MATKIINTATFSAWPRAPYKRPDGTWVFVFWNGTSILNTFSCFEANSTDGETWSTSLIFTITATWNITGGYGLVASGTELLCTSSYKLPYPSLPNNAARCWRRPEGGSWTEVGSFPMPTGDERFVPFGRFIDLPGGVIRMTVCGWDTARTYDRIYYVDSSDDGLTWGNLTNIYVGTPGTANELCYFASGNNHLVVGRREDESGTHEGGMNVFKSTNAGVTWALMGEIPAIVNRYATAPDLFQLADGRLILLYGDRGDIAYYGSAQQHSMRFVIGQFEDVFAGVAGWSDSIVAALTYPTSNGNAGYGGLFKTTDSDSSLQMVYFDGSNTDTDIWHENLGDLLPSVGSSRGYILC